MSRAPAQPRQLAVVTRSIDGCPDPVALYAALAGETPRVGSVLLESAELEAEGPRRSLIVSAPAARLACRGREATFEALSPAGESILSWLPEALGGAEDGFVAKIKSDGSSLVWSTYLGGKGVDDRRRVPEVAVGAQVVGARGVEGDEDDVGVAAEVRPLGAGRQGGEQDGDQEPRHAAGGSIHSPA